jgi:hypothetical protein
MVADRRPIVALFLFTVLTVTLGTGINITLADRAVKAERSARLANERQTEQTRAATCAVVIAQDNISVDSPPPSGNERSIAAAAAWKVLRKQLRCDQN